jgi:putative N6-adenine-specific DNA methylase
VTQDLFVVCAPGLEALAADELRDLGLEGRPVHGGVELNGTLAIAARVNLWSRIASRVLVRLGSVRATSFGELVKKARALPFEMALRKGVPVALRVTCRKSRLYHSDAVSERLHAAIEERLGGSVPLAKAAGDDDEAASPPQLIVVRFERDVCTVSADASGALLHRRGWRARGGKAPLRETIAAALLRAAGFRGSARDGALLDPLCGSGTIPIEAALLARRRAPGIGRQFSLLGWPAFDRGGWDRLVAEARSEELPKSPLPILGSDADAGAVALALSNAEQAGVGSDVTFVQKPLALVAPPAPAGFLVTNAPYGIRVGGQGDPARLFRELGELLRSRLTGWTAAVLVGDRNITRSSGLAFEPRLSFDNGGIPVELLVAKAA